LSDPDALIAAIIALSFSYFTLKELGAMLLMSFELWSGSYFKVGD
jgi:hypothetical protein